MCARSCMRTAPLMQKLTRPWPTTRAEVADLTGVNHDTLVRFWRALGFPNVSDEERTFTDLDLEAVRLFQSMQALGATRTDTALQLARVIGSSMSRIAEAELVPGHMFNSEYDQVTIPTMARLLEFVWRRQVAAGIRRAMMLRSRGVAPGESPVLAVGFADMVGFTLLSQHLSAPELAAVVRRFEELSHDIVTGLGGRVVKMIGDEVSTWPTRTPTTSCSPTCASDWPSARFSCARGTTSAQRSIWRTASSISGIPGRC